MELKENFDRTQVAAKPTRILQELYKDPVRAKQDIILDFCKKEPKSLVEITQLVNMSDRYFLKKLYLNPLIQQHKLSMTIPDKPTSKYQKYITIED